MNIWELHPPLVHFPVSLLLCGVALDLYAKLRKRDVLARPAFFLQLWGVGTGWLAALAGILALYTAPRVYEINPLTYTHPLLALLSLTGFSVLLAVRWRTRAAIASTGCTTI